MEKKLKSYLEKLDIKYEIHEHPAVFTVEEHRKLMGETPGVLHTKNLFLKDEAKKFYLVSMYANEKLNLKYLKEKLNAKMKLSFGSPDQLKEHLNAEPGHVSIFHMIHAKDLTLILDKRVWGSNKVGFHPNVNTSTLILDHDNLAKFYNSIKSPKQILEL